MIRHSTRDAVSALDQVVFLADGREYRRLDALRLAERSDVQLAGRMRRRLRLDVRDEYIDLVDRLLEEAGVEFRYARGLEDAGETVRWLEANDLTLDSWTDAIRRSVLERLPPLVVVEMDDREHGIGDADVWLPDLAVTDLMESAVDSLARRVAVALEVPAASGESAPRVALANVVPWAALGVGDLALAACDARLDALEPAWTSWLATAVTEAAMLAAADHHRLEWLVYRLTLSWWPTEDAAREASWCVRDDDDPLPDVARAAGAPALETELRLESAPAAIQDLLVAAANGDLVGPVADGPAWLLAAIVEKRPPALGEPLVRQAAAAHVMRALAAPRVERVIKRLDVRP